MANIAIYKFNSSVDTLPTFNDDFVYAYTDVDNGDGTITRTITSESLPTTIKFANCTGLLEVNELDISNLTITGSMFYGCTNLVKVEATDWDLSNITSTATMFYNCQKLAEIDVSNWNTGNVTNTSNMFRQCKALNFLDVSNWDVSKVTDMNNMFRNCIVDKLDLSKWNVESLENASWMFADCRLAEPLDLSKWNTESLTSLYAFAYRSYITGFGDLSGWKTSQITTMEFAFSMAYSLKSINLSNWDFSSKPVGDLLENTGELVSVDLSNSNITEGTGVDSIFVGSGLKELTLNGLDYEAINKVMSILPTSTESEPIAVYLSEDIDISKLDSEIVASKNLKIREDLSVKIVNGKNLIDFAKLFKANIKDYVNNTITENAFSKDYNDLENKPDIDGKIDSAIAGLVDSAPDSLNTLNELAQALGDNANFSATVIEQIGLKANKDELFSGDYNDLENKPVIDEITDEEIDAIIASLDE